MHLDAVAYIHRSSPSVRGPAVSAGQRLFCRISRRSDESSSLRRPGIGSPYPCPMSADPGSIRADGHQALPNLAVQDASADPHIITAAARTGTDIELRIHTSVAPFDVAAEEWFPAAAGFAVTVIVHTVDAQTGVPRYLPPAEAAEWVRAIFSTVDSAHGYFLGAVDPGTGSHRRGQLAYRLYLDTDRRAIPVPRQVITCPHYQLSAIDGRAEITIPTTT